MNTDILLLGTGLAFAGEWVISRGSVLCGWCSGGCVMRCRRIVLGGNTASKWERAISVVRVAFLA